MNGHKDLSGECTHKTADLASKSDWAGSLSRDPFPPVPHFCFFSFLFPLVYSPILLLPLLCLPKYNCDTRRRNRSESPKITVWLEQCWSLTFQQVSCQTRFCPCGPNKVWQDRIHVQSHVIMCVRCPRCSGGLGGRQPSRSHLETGTRNTGALNIQNSPTSVRKQALESPHSLILSLLVLICNRNIPVYCEYHCTPTAPPSSS